MKLTQELMEYTAGRWNTQKAMADELFARVQATEGESISFPKDGIDAFFKAISVGIDENFEFMDAIGQTAQKAAEQQEATTIPRVDAAKITMDALAKAQEVTALPVEFIISIGKSNEFTKFLADHGVAAK